jgi:hypothetical protein
VNTMFCRQGTPVLEIIPQVRSAHRTHSKRVTRAFRAHSRCIALALLAPRSLSLQHMLTTPVTQLFHRVASAMKLQHQSYVVPSSNVEPAGRCSLDCMHLDAEAVANVAQSVLAAFTDRK